MSEGAQSPRVIIVGDSGVGKTSLIHRIQTGTFLESLTPTIGAGVTPIDVRVNDTVIAFQLWDTAGQEMYRNIIPIYFKNAVFALVVFAFDDLHSFDNLQSWVDEVRQHGREDTPMLIIGNKHDTPSSQVNEDEAKKWASDNNLQIFFTSAKTGENVQILMQHIAMQYLKARAPVQPDIVALNDRQPRNACC